MIAFDALSVAWQRAAEKDRAECPPGTRALPYCSEIRAALKGLGIEVSTKEVVEALREYGLRAADLGAT